MKNICVVVDNELNYDVRVLREIRILQEQYEVHVVCYGVKGKKYSPIEGVILHRIRINNFLIGKLFFLSNFIPLFGLIWTRKISKIIKSIELHAIHAHDLYMSKIVYKAILKSKSKVPFILDLHENYPEAVKHYNWTKGFLRNLIAQPHKWTKVEKEYLSYPEKLIVLSADYRKIILEKYNFLKEYNVIDIPNVPEIKSFGKISKVDLKFDPDNLIFFYFGGIAERRGIFETIEAFTTIVKANGNAKLLLIGPVDKVDRKRFFELISNTEISESIIYIPWIDLSALPSYMNIAHVGLAPFEKNDQHESGIANKIFQYMYGSLAILASDCKPQRELIQQENSGLIFFSQDELISKMNYFIQNKDIAIQMGENGKKALSEKYNISLYKTKMLNFFQF